VSAAPDGTDRRAHPSLPGGVIDFAWAPDGAAFAVASPVTQANGSSTNQIFLVPLNGEPRQLTRVSDYLIVHVWDPDANLSWSPDGRWIAYATKPTPRFDDDYASDVHAVEVSTGTSRTVVQRPGMDTRPLWSPGGNYIAFRTSYGQIDRFANHGLGIVRFDTRMIQDAGSRFEGGFLDGPYTYVWADSHQVLFLGASRFGTSLLALNATTGSLDTLSQEPGTRSQLSGGWPSGQVAYVFTSEDHPWEVVVSPANTEQRTRVTRSNPELEGRWLPSFTPLSWQSGEWSVEGWLALPPEYDPGRRYPVITLLHGGPEGNFRPGYSAELPSPIFSFEPDPHFVPLLAADGYVLFLPNFRGSGGRGEQFRRAGNGADWSERFTADVLAGLDTLIARGIADSARLGLAGSRSGATKVVSMLTRTARFRAASVVTPYPDFVRDYNKSATADFRLMFEGRFGARGGKLQALLEREQPIAQAGEIRTPLQILTDEGAFNIDAEQSLALHRALWAGRVPGEIVISRGGSLDDARERLRRTREWFRRWLAPAQ
jgi:dipeptidyl aminopeptidase/acylaminoacyl peptidase